MSEPIVSIVGRPNVGKSTFFNRIIGKRQAIVDDVPGVTRDRNYAIGEWCGSYFLLVDTGGYLPESKEIIDQAVREQVRLAIDESDVIIFLVDARTGITVTDEEIAHMLQGIDKDVLLAVNKVDDERDQLEVGQFYKLGLGEPHSVSSMIGSGSGDLLDVLTEKLAKKVVRDKSENALKMAVIGKENVGKSSLVNTLLQQRRQIVTDIPGTTRDSIDSYFNYQKREFLIIDTAGLKKRAKIKENILFYSNLRTYRSIRRADVVIYMIDAQEGLTKQDVQIMMQVAQERKGLICVFNKWDVVEKDHKTMDKIKRDVKDRLGDLKYVPLIFTSVLNKQRIFKLLDLFVEVYEKRKIRISTSELNNYFEPIFKTTTPPAVHGREMKINYVTQIKAEPPLFAFYCNFPDLLVDHYKKFLENKLREKYEFSGVPVTFSFRKK
jgi:GTP-binding protein